MASARGFTLIEIMVVLILVSLLAGAVAPLAAGQIRGQRIRATHDRMERVIAGMLGHPTLGGHGYLGDFGVLPPDLDDLNDATDQPAYAVDPNDGIGAGYNGPYVPQVGGPGVAFVDAWGTPFAYRASAAQLTSFGADRRAGTADDLVYPEAPPLTTGNVSVSIVGVPNDDGPSCVLGDADADVSLSFSRRGDRRDVALAGPVGAGGPFTTTDLHKGYHGLRVAGRAGFAGAVVRDVLEVRGGNTQMRVTLIQPAGPPPACGA